MEKYFLFAVLKNLRIFQNCFFTEGVVNGNNSSKLSKDNATAGSFMFSGVNSFLW